MLDLKIVEGKLLDGSGAAARRADVGVRGGRIVAIGDLRGESAAETLDAGGRIVAPGFIDIHAHDDFNLPVNPAAYGKIMQGVTTVVNGNCGMSPAPISPQRAQEGIDLCMNQDSGLSWDWRTMGEYLDAVPPLGVNVCQLVGHSAVRVAALGNEDRAPSDRELDAMRADVDEAMRAGCFGMSTGLAMNPGSYADLPELIELSKVVARHGGSYHTHMRNEGNKVLEAIEEAIAIGRGSGAAVQISHLKITNLDYWGHAEEMLALINGARAAGQKVHADQYPYVASSGGLRARLPRWATAGTKEDVLRRLREPETRARIRYDVSEGMEKEGVSMRIYRWEKVLVATSSSHPDYVGLNLSEVAEREGKAAVDALLDLLVADDLTTRGIYFHIGEDDLRRILRDPNVSVGSDGIYYGVPGKVDATRVHPRHFGSFPRVLGVYTREQRVIDLPLAIRKMTALNAEILGLPDRGRITEGAVADLVVVDADAVLDKATFAEPHATPEGIGDVFVAGTAVVREGRDTGNTPGRVLRKGRD